MTFQPGAWARQIAMSSAVAGMIVFPTVSDSSSYIHNDIPDQAAITRLADVKKVYAELAPKMFAKAEPPEIIRVSEMIVDESQRLGIDKLFIIAIIESESNFDIEAVSPTGARGLMQIMPGTFREVSNAKRMFDPIENVRAGIRYVAKLYGLGFKSPEYVLLAYNQGPKVAISVAKKEIEMPEEAAGYVPVVMKRYYALLTKDGKSPKNARKLFAMAPPQPKTASVVR